MGIGIVDLDVPFYTDLLKGKCIGFGGKLGSGKTFFADALIEYINSNSSIKAVRRSFADELRNFVEYNVGIPVKSYKHVFKEIVDADRLDCVKAICDHVQKKGLAMDEDFLMERFATCRVYNDLYRTSLQLVGTELYRMQVDPDIWANSVGDTLDKEQITIVDDVRFPNELRVVKQNGISVYSIVLNYVETASDLHVEGHASETSIGASDFDVLFYNLIGQYSSKQEWGKVVFNCSATFYYLFHVMRDEPNKEKILRNTIKNTCLPM